MRGVSDNELEFNNLYLYNLIIDKPVDIIRGEYRGTSLSSYY